MPSRGSWSALASIALENTFHFSGITAYFLKWGSSMSLPRSGQAERARGANHSLGQSCKDRTLTAQPGEFLYRSMGETWMPSAARLGLPSGDLSASCGCACVLLEAVSKQKHPRKRIWEALNGLGQPCWFLSPLKACQTQWVNIQWWFIVWSLLLLQKQSRYQKTAKISQGPQQFYTTEL